MAGRWYNPIVSAILRSPLHGMMSGSTLLLTFSGRRSGRSYTTPVNYVTHGDTLLLNTQRGRRWWLNLRGGAPVTLRLRGQASSATAVAHDDAAQVAADLLALARQVPAYRRALRLTLDAAGEPLDRGTLQAAARRTVSIRVSDLKPTREETE